MDFGAAPVQAPEMSFETFETLVRAEFAPRTTYLNTASAGIGPRRAADALRHGTDRWADGTDSFEENEATTAAVRGAYARLTGVSPERVAVGSAVTTHVGLIAAGLPGARRSSSPTATSPPW